VSLEAEDALRVNLPAFEGPLDLLLYLIKKDELDIYDIPIASITETYLGYLELMHELNLDLAGEFLVMAAMLTTIKSRMLLPSEGGGDGEEAEDPRSSLVERLLEYQRYKEVAEALAKRGVLNRDVFERGQSAMNLPEGEPVRLPEISLFELLNALQTVLGEARARGFVHQVVAERFSVVDRIHWLHDRIRTERVIGFRSLFRAFGTRMEIILTFLALLEMLKANILRLDAVHEHDDPEVAPTDWVVCEREPGAALTMDMTGVD
jgi:segregation and condensation protein A